MLAAIRKIFTQGSISRPGTHGYCHPRETASFINAPNGAIAFTRAGTAKLDFEGKIVTSDGYSIEPNITIPANQRAYRSVPQDCISDDANGSVSMSAR